jgi:hypothetical protein
MDPATMAMLAQQLGNGGVIGSAEEPPLAGQPANPLVSTLLSQMTSSSADTERAERVESLERQLEAAKRRISRLRASIATAEQMVELIAVTFGTCPDCWGLHQSCRLCRGDGGPGWRPPDIAELLQWVEPALARTGLRVQSTQESIVDTTRKAGHHVLPDRE